MEVLFKHRLEGIDRFARMLEELALGHLRECRRASPDLCVASLAGEVDGIISRHTFVVNSFEEDPALGALDTFTTTINYDLVSKDVALAAEELWAECPLAHVAS